MVATIETASELSDEDVLARVSAGDIAAFELIMRRYNRRLFRAVRAILKDDGEVEEARRDDRVPDEPAVVA